MELMREHEDNSTTKAAERMALWSIIAIQGPGLVMALPETVSSACNIPWIGKTWKQAAFVTTEKREAVDCPASNPTTTTATHQNKANSIKKGSSIDQVLNLFFNSHEFEFFQSNWRFTWSLTSEPVKLIKIHTNNLIVKYLFYFIQIQKYHEKVMLLTKKNYIRFIIKIIKNL